MGRDSLRSGKPYDPSSVQLKFDLTSPTTSYMPIVFDLVDNKLIFADVTSGTGRHGRVATGDKYRETMKGILTMPDRKATVSDVLNMHVAARGKLVGDPAKADIVFMHDVDVDAILRDYVD